MSNIRAGSERMFFFFQAEDGIRDLTVTGVQTCALPICAMFGRLFDGCDDCWMGVAKNGGPPRAYVIEGFVSVDVIHENGRASGRVREEISGVAVTLKKKKCSITCPIFASLLVRLVVLLL